MNEPSLLTLPEIAERAGVEYRTLKLWVDRGLLGRIKFKGSGRRTFLREDIARLAETLGRLRRHGLTLQIVAKELRSGEAFCPICGTRLKDSDAAT